MRGRDALFPDFSELGDAENALTGRLNVARLKYADRKAVAEPPSSKWLDDLRAKQFDKTEDLETLMDWVIDALGTGSVQMTHPG